MNTKGIAQVINDKISRHAFETRALDTGKVSAVNDGNLVDVKPGGMIKADGEGATYSDVPQGGLASFRKWQEGDSLLLLRIGGGPNGIAHVGQNPYSDGLSFTFER